MPDNVSALHLALSGDPSLLAIVRLSLLVGLSAVLLAAAIDVPFGALIALTHFRGREAAVVVLNASMGLPPVVAGRAREKLGSFPLENSWSESSGSHPGPRTMRNISRS
jgi:tungstate transport system permease protein